MPIVLMNNRSETIDIDSALPLDAMTILFSIIIESYFAILASQDPIQSIGE